LARLEARGKDIQTIEADRTDLQARLKAALAARLAAEQDAASKLTEAQQKAILLAKANEALSKEKARSAEAMRKVALLNQQTAELRKQLDTLQGLLDEANARDAASKVQIQALGKNLNTALAQVAAEQRRVAEEQRKRAEKEAALAEEQRKLAEEQRKRAELEAAERKRLEAETKSLRKFKSEFFGKMRDVLADRPGVKVVGDRFVFASEVLFAPGSAELSENGKHEIAKVARLIQEVEKQIPPEFNWVLRVDGHTDNVPLSGTGEFKDNWQLSQARALAVVRYMIDELHFPPNRLAATGFGEYQPVNPANTPQARAQNRRIEIKFTER
jgi:Flagellar motor protein